MHNSHRHSLLDTSHEPPQILMHRPCQLSCCHYNQLHRGLWSSTAWHWPARHQSPWLFPSLSTQEEALGYRRGEKRGGASGLWLVWQLLKRPGNVIWKYRVFYFPWNEFCSLEREEKWEPTNQPPLFLLLWAVPRNSIAYPETVHVAKEAHLPSHQLYLLGFSWSRGIHTSLALASHPSLPCFLLPSASPL